MVAYIRSLGTGRFSQEGHSGLTLRERFSDLGYRRVGRTLLKPASHSSGLGADNRHTEPDNVISHSQKRVKQKSAPSQPQSNDILFESKVRVLRVATNLVQAIIPQLAYYHARKEGTNRLAYLYI